MRDSPNVTRRRLLEREAGGFVMPPRLKAHVIGFELSSHAYARVDVQLATQAVFKADGLYLEASPRGIVHGVWVGTECLTQGPIHATAFGFKPLAGATALLCSLCGAPLPFDALRPICVCAYCKAPSVVCVPDDVPPDFVRQFCAGMPSCNPGVLIRLQLEGVRSGHFWGRIAC